jgi:hypothetical protein
MSSYLPPPPSLLLPANLQPHLFNLPLHPLDAFTYGQLYSVPLLARHNEPYFLSYFSEYIDTHFKTLILQSTDAAVNLVNILSSFLATVDGGNPARAIRRPMK